MTMTTQLCSMFPLVLPVDASFREYRGYISMRETQMEQRGGGGGQQRQQQRQIQQQIREKDVAVHAKLLQVGLIDSGQNNTKTDNGCDNVKSQNDDKSSSEFVWEVCVHQIPAAAAGHGESCSNMMNSIHLPTRGSTTNVLSARSPSFSLLHNGSGASDTRACVSPNAEDRLCEVLRQLKSAAERGDIEVGTFLVGSKSDIVTNMCVENLDANRMYNRITELDLIGWENVESIQDLNLITLVCRYDGDLFVRELNESFLTKSTNCYYHSLTLIVQTIKQLFIQLFIHSL